MISGRISERPVSAQNSNMIDHFVANLSCYQDQQSFQNELESFDQHIYDQYSTYSSLNNQINKELYNDAVQNPIKLSIPKYNSLTDTMMRSTLGCEDKLAKSYLQIVENPAKRQDEQKRKKTEAAKKKFAQSNHHKDLIANGKPFMNTVRFAIQRPVIDNQHESYLKTQLIFLQQPKGPNVNAKEYFDKHSDMIAKKINQLGGMEDTIGRMQQSLSRNEVKGFKKKQVLAGMSKERKKLFSPQKLSNGSDSNRLRDSWVNRSKEMRESFIAKLNIE